MYDFSESQYTQIFKNKLNNEYIQAINGHYNQTDVFDLQYNTAHGWSMRYWNQKVQLPKLRENIKGRVNFGAFLAFTITQVNPFVKGSTQMGLIHRFKYVGSTLTRKFYMSIYKDEYGGSIEIHRSLGWRYDHLSTITCYDQSNIKRYVM